MVSERENNTRKSASKKQIFEALFAVWSFFRPVLIFITGLFVVLAAIYYGIDYARDKYWLPADPTDHTPIEVEIKRGSRPATIAKTLESYHLVKNATVFEYYIDFSGYANKLKAGTYIFNKQMSMQEIMEKLAHGDGRANVTKFTIIEGSTIEEMAKKLKDDEIISDTDGFLSLCKTGKAFKSFNFLSDLDTDENIARKYMLEGYLFPDTYEIYVGASAESIITKMLHKFSDVLTEKYIYRAEELNMSINEVVTLASLIENESRPGDFAKVSAVFHNRLKKDMRLESCVTVQYALGIKRLKLTAEDIAIESPYNTYKYKGLPIGPVCSPSQKAIEAALYPDETYVEEGYLFFASKNPESGELEFNKTLDAHNAAVEKYSPLWEEYDKKHGN